jgi:hypothetical protein
MERIDPARLNRIRRDVPTIYVSTLGGASFSEGPKMIWLDGSMLLTVPVEVNAGLLVHEGAHARHCRRGIPAWPDLRPRLERLAVRQQNKFLNQLPREEYPRVDVLIRWNELALQDPWWTLKRKVRRYINAQRNIDPVAAPAAEPVVAADVGPE